MRVEGFGAALAADARGADAELPAAFGPELHVTKHALALLGRDHRAELDARIRRIADADRRGLGCELLDELRVHLLVHDLAAAADARLARADERAERGVA